MSFTDGVLIQTSSGPRSIHFSEAEISRLDTSGSGDNVQSILLLFESWMCLLADSPLTPTRGFKPPRMFHAFARHLVSQPLQTTIKEYSSLAHELVSSALLYGSDLPNGEFLPAFRDTPIFMEYHAWFEDSDSSVLRWIYSFLNFGKKVDFADENMNANAFRGWLAVEEKLSTHEYPPDILGGLRVIMRELTRTFTPSDLWPKFGPGAVAEPGVRGNIAKASNLSIDPRLERVFFKGHFASYGLNEEHGFHPSGVIPDLDVWNYAAPSVDGAVVGKVCKPVSELRAVPKDVDKARLICMEPNSFMFFQQAVLRWLSDCIASGPARWAVCLSDQSRNRRMAEFGSDTGLIDTIDLSSASDSVGIKLVRAVFPRNVLYYLLGTRTSRVQLQDKSVVSVHKFAPMGSAVCFPTQCLIFTSIALYAALLHRAGLPPGSALPEHCLRDFDADSFFRQNFRRDVDDRRNSDRLFEPLAVYGDDICVDNKLTQHVLHLLGSLCFSTNVRKSFIGSQAFRESCGGFYLRGSDITPLYYRVKNPRAEFTAQATMSAIAFANRAGDMGYFITRRHIVHTLLYGRLENVRRHSSLPNPILFTDNKSLPYGIYTVRPRNTHLKVRKNLDLQRDECLCLAPGAGRRIHAKPFEKDALERYLYLQWWGARLRGEASSEFSFGASRDDLSGSRLRGLWQAL